MARNIAVARDVNPLSISQTLIVVFPQALALWKFCASPVKKATSTLREAERVSSRARPDANSARLATRLMLLRLCARSGLRLSINTIDIINHSSQTAFAVAHMFGSHFAVCAHDEHM